MHLTFQVLQDMIPSAYKRIKDYIVRTPLETSIALSTENQMIYLKLECVQTTRSFKLRGAMNKLLSLTEKEKASGVIAVSSGNHGAAVSYAGKRLGIDQTQIFVPTITPYEKTSKIAYYGGEVICLGDDYDETHQLGMAYVKSHQMTYVDAYDKDPMVYAGQGTVGLEILQQNPQIDTVLVPIGGGGLITGISAAVKAINPNIKVIGLQTAACPAMKASIEEGVFYDKYPIEPSVCEALVGGVGELAYQLSNEAIDDIIIVEESAILQALNHMIFKEKIIAEASSCIGVAALLHNRERIKGREIAVVISGGNIDENLLKKVME